MSLSLICCSLFVLQLGKTMVFLKAEAARALERMQTEKMMSLRPIVEFVEAAYRRISLKRNLEAVLPALIRAEAHCRRYVLFPAHALLYRHVFSCAHACLHACAQGKSLEV